VFEGRDLSSADEAELTEHVGFVFQFYNLSPSLTVRKYVALTPRRDPCSRRPFSWPVPKAEATMTT
jgi:putative ABC transport system ATP-binding protein